MVDRVDACATMEMLIAEYPTVSREALMGALAYDALSKAKSAKHLEASRQGARPAYTLDDDD